MVMNMEDRSYWDCSSNYAFYLLEPIQTSAVFHQLDYRQVNSRGHLYALEHRSRFYIIHNILVNHWAEV